MKVLTGCPFALLGLVAGFVLPAVLGLLLIPDAGMEAARPSDHQLDDVRLSVNRSDDW